MDEGNAGTGTNGQVAEKDDDEESDSDDGSNEGNEAASMPVTRRTVTES